MPISKEVLDEIALSKKEYELIVQRLGHEPTTMELGMFGSLWSEHCGYKQSKRLLKLLPIEQIGLMWHNGLERALRGFTKR